MVKRIWLAVTFVAGIAVGVMVTRLTPDPPATEAKVTIGIPAAPPDSTPVATPSAVATGSSARPPSAADSINVDTVAEARPVPAATSPIEPATAESVAVQPIDAGEVFNKVLAQPSQAGFENNIAEAHRALEREKRDDGWAYSMEAEIQNSMVNEVSTGAFRAEHVECRTTMCELRLSGNSDQGAAIKRWNDELGAQPFGQRLFLNYSSTISDNGRVDALMIFRRPPKN